MIIYGSKSHIWSRKNSSDAMNLECQDFQPFLAVAQANRPYGDWGGTIDLSLFNKCLVVGLVWINGLYPHSCYALGVMPYVSCTMLNCSSTMCHALCIMHNVSCTLLMHFLPCTMYHALFALHYVSCTMRHTLFVVHYVSCTKAKPLDRVHTNFLVVSQFTVYTDSLLDDKNFTLKSSR